ncbi:hypothetical protein [Kitasatospora griseola]|uniref:hypothetical protein n=1 Tax=Kitasatospora griseola TaxID=2064 RepID=UPI00128D9004|nr:hypothetical protein [Kitasatospora griseola]
MFDAMMHEFGPENVRGISGEWLAADDLADNLMSYNAGIQDMLSPEVAALNIFTGKMATRWGFSKVEGIETAGTPGNYINVSALFVRPEW